MSFSVLYIDVMLNIFGITCTILDENLRIGENARSKYGTLLFALK